MTLDFMLVILTNVFFRFAWGYRISNAMAMHNSASWHRTSGLIYNRSYAILWEHNAMTIKMYSDQMIAGMGPSLTPQVCLINLTMRQRTSMFLRAYFLKCRLMISLCMLWKRDSTVQDKCIDSYHMWNIAWHHTLYNSRAVSHCLLRQSRLADFTQICPGVQHIRISSAYCLAVTHSTSCMPLVNYVENTINMTDDTFHNFHPLVSCSAKGMNIIIIKEILHLASNHVQPFLWLSLQTNLPIASLRYWNDATANQSHTQGLSTWYEDWKAVSRVLFDKVEGISVVESCSPIWLIPLMGGHHHLNFVACCEMAHNSFFTLF